MAFEQPEQTEAHELEKEVVPPPTRGDCVAAAFLFVLLSYEAQGGRARSFAAIS